MDDHLPEANHLNISPSHPGQLSPLPSAGRENEYQPNWGDALRLGSKGRMAGWLFPYVDKRLGGRQICVKVFGTKHHFVFVLLIRQLRRC